MLLAPATELIAARTRTAAVADIQRVMATAADKADRAGVDAIKARARAPFELVEHEPEVVQAFLQRFHDLAVWRHDGNCFNRSMAGVHLLDEMSGTHAGPLDDVFAGAIHVERERVHPGVAERFSDLAHDEPTGRFHGSAAIRIKGHENTAVIDFLHDTPFVRFRADDLPADTELVRPFAGTGVPWAGGGQRTDWVGSGYFHDASSWLTNAWHNASDRPVRTPELADMVARAKHPLPEDQLREVDNRKISVRANEAISFD